METHNEQQQELPFESSAPEPIAPVPEPLPSFPPIIGTAVIVVPLY